MKQVRKYGTVYGMQLVYVYRQKIELVEQDWKAADGDNLTCSLRANLLNF